MDSNLPTRAAALPGAGRSFDALIVDSASRQGLACIRSLGRAGLSVAAAESFAESDPALPVLGFRSRYAGTTLVLPSFAADPRAFAAGVVEFVRRNPTRVVLPTTDGSIAALLPRRAELSSLGCVLALASDEALAIANDKSRTLALAANLDIAGPSTFGVDTLADLAPLLSTLRLPFVLKPATSWAAADSLRLQAVEVVDADEAERVATGLLKRGVGVLGQEWVCGRREGVTLFRAGGELKAAFAHLEHRTTPVLGGASVVRESIPVPRDVLAHSIALARAMQLDGLCEVEFRRDGSGRPYLMEVNARVPGLVESAVACGVDFPLMIWQHAVGRPITPVDTYRTGLRMRWLRGDMRWLRDNQLRSRRPDNVSSGRALVMFVAEFLRSSRYDTFDSRDPRPMVAELRNTLAAVRQQLAGRDLVHDGPEEACYVE